MIQRSNRVLTTDRCLRSRRNLDVCRSADPLSTFHGTRVPTELDLEDAVRQWQAFAAGKLFAVASRRIPGLAAAGGRNGGPPLSFTLADLRKLPSRSQITHIACEEGWSFIAEWTGIPLSVLLDAAGTRPEAKFVASYSAEKDASDSIDMADALHPQTLVTYGMNGGNLPVGHGGPLRLRVPCQLGHKSLKYLSRLTVTDDLNKLGRELSDSVARIRLVRRDLNPPRNYDRVRPATSASHNAVIAEEETKAGTMLGNGGLRPTTVGARVQLSGGKVTDGPFTEAREVVGGYGEFELKSKEEAIESAVRFMELHKKHWPEWEGETEVRQMYGAEDCVPETSVDECRGLGLDRDGHVCAGL